MCRCSIKWEYRSTHSATAMAGWRGCPIYRLSRAGAVVCDSVGPDNVMSDAPSCSPINVFEHPYKRGRRDDRQDRSVVRIASSVDASGDNTRARAASADVTRNGSSDDLTAFWLNR